MTLVRAAVLVFAAAVAGCASTPSPAPRAGEGWFAGADSVRLFYSTCGRGGDAVVVVHEFQGNAQGYLAADLPPSPAAARCSSTTSAAAGARRR